MKENYEKLIPLVIMLLFKREKYGNPRKSKEFTTERSDK